MSARSKFSCLECETGRQAPWSVPKSPLSELIDLHLTWQGQPGNAVVFFESEEAQSRPQQCCDDLTQPMIPFVRRLVGEGDVGLYVCAGVGEYLSFLPLEVRVFHTKRSVNESSMAKSIGWQSLMNSRPPGRSNPATIAAHLAM